MNKVTGHVVVDIPSPFNYKTFLQEIQKSAIDKIINAAYSVGAGIKNVSFLDLPDEYYDYNYVSCRSHITAGSHCALNVEIEFDSHEGCLAFLLTFICCSEKEFDI